MEATTKAMRELRYQFKEYQVLLQLKNFCTLFHSPQEQKTRFCETIYRRGSFTLRAHPCRSSFWAFESGVCPPLGLKTTENRETHFDTASFTPVELQIARTSTNAC
jgi:hypothetical protein